MSGKQARRRRQQTSAPPPVARKGERRRASPKVLAIGAVVALVVAGAAVGIALAVGGGSSSTSGTVQNRAFNFMQIVYANQGTENTGWLNQSFIEHAAASVPGMDVRRLLDSQDSAAVQNAIDRINSQGDADRVASTPALFIGKTGSKLRPVSSGVTFDQAKL